ncbi:MAG TPA: tripartite tricarboxylate transporter substrate-binding protein [Xanthobacteraceae bacterium]|nr:tripartite tricarboxylate transporter substrate-binding protein [Xanthobacteraceae bacterium]
MDRRQFVVGTTAAAASALAAPAIVKAQGGNTIRIIFPYAAGGSGDVPVRLVADKLTTLLNQPVVVENRTGGAGRIGVSAVVNSAPDGLTFLYTPFAAVTIFPQVYKSLDYDPFTQLRPVSQLCTFDFAIAVSNSVPAKTPKELATWLKANPAKAQFGSPGAGALPHFFGLMFGKAAGVEMTHIGYKGGAPAMADLLGDQIPMVSSTASEFLDLHKAGKLRVIATSDVERSLGYTDVPTFKESGFDIVGTSWYAMFAPAKTPDGLVERMNKAVVAAIRMPDVRERLITVGLSPTGTTAAELGQIQRAHAKLWEPVIKASGFTAD